MAWKRLFSPWAGVRGVETDAVSIRSPSQCVRADLAAVKVQTSNCAPQSYRKSMLVCSAAASLPGTEAIGRRAMMLINSIHF